MLNIDSYALEAFKKFIHERDDFLIISHVNPDGDAVSSSLAMAYILESAGKEYTITCQDVYPKRFVYLNKYDELKRVSELNRKYNNIIAVDTADLKRMGTAFDLIAEDRMIVNIDHHLVADCFGDINIVISSAASTTEVIYHLAKALDIKYSKELAEYIYTGILTDTGGFRYANTSNTTLAIAAELVSYGISPGEMADHALERVSLAYLDVLKLVLNNAEYYDNNKIIGSVIDYRNLEKLEDETDGLVNLLRNINDVEISFLIKEDKPNHFRISLRSTNQVDVSIVASKFDGGGHFSAAGFSYVGDLQELKSKIVEEILMVKKKASNYQSE